MTFLGHAGASAHGNLRGDEPFPARRPRRRWPTPSCARNLAQRHRHHPRQAGRAWSASCRTGSSCARRARRSRTTSSPTSTRYLVQLEEQVTARGGTVHWARDADEANAIVTGLVQATGAREVVKVKSMATQEIGLNEALEAAGITAIETDLAELIVQLGHDKPEPHPGAGHPPQPQRDPRDLPARDARRRPGAHRRAARCWPRPPGGTCGASSSPPRWRSAARTSPSPRPARSPSSSPRATGGCA